MAALRLGDLHTWRAAGAGRTVWQPGDSARAVPVSRRADGWRVACHHGHRDRAFGPATAECREPVARMRGYNHADLLDRRPAFGVWRDAQPYLYVAAVLFRDAGRDRRRSDLAVRPCAE